MPQTTIGLLSEDCTILARPVDRIFPEAIAPTSSYLDSPGTESVRSRYDTRDIRLGPGAATCSKASAGADFEYHPPIRAATCGGPTLGRALRGGRVSARKALFFRYGRMSGRGIAIRRVLAGKGCDARLVIGVTLPFAAHCWVQLGSAVLTDPLDVVLPYTPILIA